MNRFPPLDFVRTCAITLVVMRHIFDRFFSNTDIPNILKYIMSFGWFGVHLFFTLSGFLIGGMIYKQIKEGRFSFKRFYLKRSLRILPLAFIFLLFSCHKELAFNKTTLFNFLFITNYTGNAFASHYWSLNVEEHFYLLFPVSFFLLCLITRKVKYLITFLSVAILITWIYRALVTSSKVYELSHLQVDYFLFGILLAILWNEKLLHKYTIPNSFLYIPLFFLSLSMLTVKLNGYSFVYNQKPEILSFLYPLFAMFSFFFVGSSILQQGVMLKVMSLKIFKTISILSYSIYVWHLFVIDNLNRFINHLPPLTIFVIVITSVIVCSFLSYWIIEKPFLLLREKLVK